jgi:hypothetical protein
MLHIHQYAVFPNYLRPTLPAHRIEAGPNFKKVVDSITGVFNLGTPDDYSNGNSEGEPEFSQQRKDLMYFGYTNPVYLKY